jgi:hypothetical protein
MASVVPSSDKVEPFSLVCRGCDPGTDMRSNDQALAGGWSEINYAPDLPMADFIGIMPRLQSGLLALHDNVWHRHRCRTVRCVHGQIRYFGSRNLRLDRSVYVRSRLTLGVTYNPDEGAKL